MLKSISQVPKRTLETEESIRKSWSKGNLSKATFHDGWMSQLDLGNEVTVFIHPKPCSVKSKDKDGKPVTRQVAKAYAITCAKPIGYGKLINAAELQEYDVANGEMEAINRKGRQNPEDPQVKVHDEFIDWVKQGLKAIGIN